MSTTIPFHIALGSIENPSADWGQVRRRLAQLTELIDTLTTERQLLQTALDSVVYPVLTLPPEITSNIFLQSIPEDATPSRHASPLLLTQICHQWRAIALATPGLWQSITLEHVWQPTGCHCTALLQMWLQYSATRPLFLSFGCEVQMQRLIDTSLIHCHRWQEITLSSHVTLTAPHTHFPILRKVTLARHIGGTVVIHNAPELRQANFRTVPTFVVALPWARLTSLAVQTFAHASDCLPMLIHCSNLRHLTHSAVAYRGGGFALPHATLDSLQSLTLGVNSSGLMPHLTLPHLRHLTLIGKFLTTTREHLQALLWRSSCTLLRMSVILDGGEDSSPAGLRSLLQVIPTVTDLTLTVRSSLHLHHAVGPLTYRTLSR
ncbi:hypothetical protein FB451DRAFT_394160 [Mycena latifolia]|nr:hypothetical protein FB451DRAFT_394160 [Mycena latifolia]